VGYSLKITVHRRDSNNYLNVTVATHMPSTIKKKRPCLIGCLENGMHELGP